MDQKNWRGIYITLPHLNHAVRITTLAYVIDK